MHPQPPITPWVCRSGMEALALHLIARFRLIMFISLPYPPHGPHPIFNQQWNEQFGSASSVITLFVFFVPSFIKPAFLCFHQVLGTPSKHTKPNAIRARSAGMEYQPSIRADKGGWIGLSIAFAWLQSILCLQRGHRVQPSSASARF